MGVIAALARLVPVEVPVDPDAEEARRLLAEELAKSRYQEAQGPTRPEWLDRLIEDFLRMFDGLGGQGTAPFWTAVVVIVAIAVIVVAFLVFGVPRLRARSGVSAADELFEADDRRDAAAMRRDADAAARRGEWGRAIAERFRAIARGLHERTLVSTVPGSTAHDVARRAAAALPEHADALARAAHDFDAVRYLGDPGDPERYERLVALDRAVERTRPRFAAEDPASDAAGVRA